MADERPIGPTLAQRGHKEVTKELPTPKPPRIAWKVVQGHHYLHAQELKKQGKEAYTDYVMVLVEAWDFADKDGAHIPTGAGEYLSKEQTGQVLAAFEARFGEEKE